MAVATGTATSPTDFYNKLQAFLKTNADLVSAGEEWDQVWADSDSTDVMLRGPGLSSGDAVYVGMSLYSDPILDEHWISFRGATGVNAQGQSYADHPNPSPQVRMFLDLDPMEYWFVASGRRFICVVKISTVFEACYCGLFLPYATPLSYPYPLFIGGSAGRTGGNPTGGAANSWRSTGANHRHFTSPHSLISPYTVYPGAYLLDPSGQWIALTNPNKAGGDTSQAGMAPEWAFDAFGWDHNNSYLMSHASFQARIRDCFGGGYALTPLHMVQKTPTDQTFGVLDGCYKVTGFSNASENIITIDGKNHLTVQNVFRTGFGDYWSLRLE